MSVQEFLNSVSNPRTRKDYRFGLNKFVEWFGKSAEKRFDFSVLNICCATRKLRKKKLDLQIPQRSTMESEGSKMTIFASSF
jgi:hypothetical protein